MSEITVRALATHDEFAEAVRLEQQIWGFADLDLTPAGLFVVASSVGGQAFGAFHCGRMVGFCLAFPGLKPGGLPYLHSHMLAVLPAYRDQGVGRLLKLEQRKEALERGVNLVEWTFDPLEIKNAWFNIERLGAVVRRYVLNRYGAIPSPLFGELPTDRCVAEWWIAGRRVTATLGGERPRAEVQRRIDIPAGIAELRQNAPKQAREIQKSASERFLDAFAAGLAVIGFERSDCTGTYLLGQWDSE